MLFNYASYEEDVMSSNQAIPKKMKPAQYTLSNNRNFLSKIIHQCFHFFIVFLEIRDTLSKSNSINGRSLRFSRDCLGGQLMMESIKTLVKPVMSDLK